MAPRAARSLLFGGESLAAERSLLGSRRGAERRTPASSAMRSRDGEDAVDPRGGGARRVEGSSWSAFVAGRAEEPVADAEEVLVVLLGGAAREPARRVLEEHVALVAPRRARRGRAPTGTSATRAARGRAGRRASPGRWPPGCPPGGRAARPACRRRRRCSRRWPGSASPSARRRRRGARKRRMSSCV